MSETNDQKWLTIIAAVNNRGVIGDSSKTGLLWKDKEDLKRFKEITMGRTLIVGRKTYENMPPLPGRKVIVVSRGVSDKLLTRIENEPGTEFMPFETAVYDFPDAWVIGGGEIYRAAIATGRVKHWYISRVDDDSEGDITFPLEAIDALL